MTPFALDMGCRRGCSAEVIVALARYAASQLPPHVAPSETWTAECGGLFTIAAKRDEAGLRLAAEHLGVPLVLLTAEALRAALPDVKSRSTRVEAAVGVPSVAEAAALVGAGPGARLIVPRLSRDGATCAIAAAWR